MSDDKRKGLRFEVYQNFYGWTWEFWGAEGIVAKAPKSFSDEQQTRSHIATNKGRLGNAKRAKVVTVLDD